MNIRNDKGVTIIAVVITVLVMFIIISTISFSSKNGIDMKKINNMYSDILILEDKVAMYYLENKTLPVIEEKISYDSIPDDIKSMNSNDNDVFYRIDVSLLDNVTLNNARNTLDSAGDFYIINEKSHSIYYFCGVKVNEYSNTDESGEVQKTYYTISRDESNIDVENVIQKVDELNVPEPPVVSDKLFDKITKYNYGDYIDYDVDLNLTENLEGETSTPRTDWRIFYKDDNYVYIIAADIIKTNHPYFPKTALGGGTIYSSDYYGMTWRRFTIPTMSTSYMTGTNNMFGLNSSSYTLNSYYTNSKIVSKMLDTSLWSNFVNDKGERAIGSPTIEMLVNSAKEIGYIKPHVKIDISSYGYTLTNNTTNSYSNSVNFTDINNLYIPHKRTLGTYCKGYWLASPANYSSYYMYAIDWGSNGYSNIPYLKNTYYEPYYGNTYYTLGFRPVVALKSDVKATRKDMGIWVIE